MAGNPAAGPRVPGIMSTMRTRCLLPMAAVLTGALLTACGHEDDDTARDSASASARAEGGKTGGSEGSTTAWPDFAPTSYVYRLEVLCFCPLVGPLRVTVEDGEVTSAIILGGEKKGEEAPDFARLTINDVIARANDPQVAEAEVTWPAGQAHPTTVAIDQIERATDDEVTYTIRDVQVR